nr:MAG TPA: nucleotide kinase [Caudoviricetes sp.]
MDKEKEFTNVFHPSYYNSHPSGVECIEIARYYSFNLGNVIKYIWRAGLKKEKGITDTEKQIEDLQKAQFYLTNEIERLIEK